MSLFLAGLAVFVPFTLVISNALDFYDMAHNERYKTPWYSTNWLREPFTNAALQFYPAKEYWTQNAIKSERWLVREHAVGSVTFWTTLKREPVSQ
jgi:hypothetical protein